MPHNQNMDLKQRAKYCMVLGVLPTASLEEIKQAYRKLALKFHPDKHQNDDIAKVRFQKVNEAYQELSSAKNSALSTETVTEIPTLTDDIVTVRNLKIAEAAPATSPTPPAPAAAPAPTHAGKASDFVQIAMIVLVSFFAGSYIQSSRSPVVVKEVKEVVRFENANRPELHPRAPANLPPETELAALKDEELALKLLCKNARVQNGLMKISAVPPLPVMTLSQARPKAISDAEAQSVVALSERLRAQQLKMNHEAASASRQIDSFCNSYQ